jgi:dUTPase
MERIYTGPVVEVVEGDLDATERGAGGFGSTGLSSC